MSWNKIPKVIINLRERKDRKLYMKKHLKKIGIDKYKFYITKRHQNPVKGCLESHINIIKMAKEKQWNCVWILEDDCVFKQKIKDFPIIPPLNKWDMLYPGANVKELLKKEYFNKWNRVCCLTTHSYIVKKEMYDILIEIINNNLEKPIDVIYSDIVHKTKIALSHYPNLVEQLPDYSEIEGKFVSYKFRNGIDDNMINILKNPNVEKKDGNIILKLNYIKENDLPNVSVIILTGNRKKFIDIFYYYAQWFDYPRHKLEFLFLDDGQEDISDIMKKDERFQHIKLTTKDKSRIPLSQKRNLGVEMAKYEYIVFCDDDDYYPPSSIKARINALLTYEKDGIECVCCSKLGLYDLTTGNSSCSSGNDIGEASLGFKKSFWRKQKFDLKYIGGEGMSLIKDRYHQVMQLPYSFVLIAITHSCNFTEDLRNIKNKYKENEQSNYFNDFPLLIQQKLLKIKKSRN